VGFPADPMIAVFQDQLCFRISGKAVNPVGVFNSNGLIVAAVDDQDMMDETRSQRLTLNVSRFSVNSFFKDPGESSGKLDGSALNRGGQGNHGKWREAGVPP
jgi:hypothetical protein